MPPLPLIRGQGSVGQTTEEPAESPVRAPVGGLWLTNVVLLLGVEVNAQFEHARAIADGFRKTCVLLPNRRDTRKLDQGERQAVEKAQAARRS